jgi:arylsulfatase A-like enzyme
MPHTPLVPQSRYFDWYASGEVTLPSRSESALESGFEGHLMRARERRWYTQTDEQLRQSLCGYYGNISQMDACVGRVYNALRELGLDRETVVVYTSDHGEMAGAHRMWTKHNMYEQSVNVPLIVSLPGHTGANALSHEVIEQVDLFPMLAELCGFKAPKDIAGVSFAPLLEGRRYRPREFAYSEYYFCRDVFTRDNRYVGRDPILMVRTDEWKLNLLRWGRSELFNLRTDPGEHVNVVDETRNRGVVKELRAVAERLYRS